VAKVRAEADELIFRLEFAWMDDPRVAIFVCVSCRRPVGDTEDSFDQPGPRLAEALQLRLSEGGHESIAVTPVECLAVCKRPCTVALTSADKWTYLIGDLDPELHVGEIVSAAFAFGASDNGIIPWRERPPSFRKGVVARVPPLAFKGFPQ
jgi:predicted metal-binding protein